MNEKNNARETARNHKERQFGGRQILEICFLIVLVLYPMRHVGVGGDLWDVGYNYGNYAYFGIKALGKTWFFATFLANAVGRLLTFLPYGHTVLGLNVYTGLFPGLLALMGYFFCTRTLKIAPVWAFLGELLALSVCWCPTALLYNYLTYVFFLACVILLYHGLTREKSRMLVLAGACLGANVFVRFSNLPEMGLILVVWAYAFWDGLEKRVDGEPWIGRAFSKLMKDTLFCLSGYLGVLAVGFAWIAIRYGIGEYVTGIQLLFAMTETATDYKPTAMLSGLLWPCREAVYWIPRLSFFAVLAFGFMMITEYLPFLFHEGAREKAGKFFRILGMAGAVLSSACLAGWMLYPRKTEEGYFTSFLYTSYDSMYWPTAIVMMLGMGFGLWEVIYPRGKKENKLFAAMLILVGILTSLGSNNGIYPSFNNLFVLLPYLLTKVAEFTCKAYRKLKERPGSAEELRPQLFPVIVVLWTFLIVCAVQLTLFGVFFVFCEGTGVRDANAFVSHNRALRGIRMSEERATALSELSAFAEKEKLSGEEVILHGRVPALAFYLEVEPAMHTWNDLDSFGYGVMQETVDHLMQEISEGKSKKPVVIASAGYGDYGPILPGGDGTAMEEDPKWQLIQRFMGLYGYEKTFENERFVVWQAK